MGINRRLDQALERKGKTRRALRREGALSGSAHRNIAAGHTDGLQLATVRKVAAAAGCSPAWLAFGFQKPSRLRLRPQDALVLRVDPDELLGGALEAWVEEVRRAWPGRRVVVLLQGELRGVAPAQAAALLAAQQRLLAQAAQR